VVNGIGRSWPVAAQNNIGRGRQAAGGRGQNKKFKNFKKNFQISANTTTKIRLIPEYT
jgi:hypothetical protein